MGASIIFPFDGGGHRGTEKVPGCLRCLGWEVAELRLESRCEPGGLVCCFLSTSPALGYSEALELVACSWA